MEPSGAPYPLSQILSSPSASFEAFLESSHLPKFLPRAQGYPLGPNLSFCRPMACLLLWLSPEALQCLFAPAALILAVVASLSLQG